MQVKPKLLKWVFLLYVFLATATVAGDGARSHFTLKLKWFHQFQFAGYYAAVEKGYYRDEGLEIELQELGVSDSVVDDVLAGRSDFGITGSSLILRRFAGDPVVMLAAIFQSSPLALMTMAKDNIKSPLDLIGKRVMYRPREDDAQLTAMFNEFDLGQEDFVFVAHNLDDDALLKGQVDAISVYVTNQPYLYAASGHQVNIINPANYGVDFYGDILFTSEKLIDENPQAVLAFRRASLKGWQYALENQEQVVDWILEKYSSKQKQPKDRAALLYEARATRRLIKPELVDIGHISPQRFQRLANIYREHDLVTPGASLRGMYYTEYFQGDSSRELTLRVSIIAASLVAMVVALMGFFNRRLKRQVRARGQALVQADAKLRRYLKTINQYTITAQFDLDFKFVGVSDAFCRISGYQRETLIGKKYDAIWELRSNEGVYEEMKSTLLEGSPWRGELVVTTGQAEILNVEVNIEPLVKVSDDYVADDIEGGDIEGYASVWVDITDKKRIELLSITDTLTGLYNRMKINTTLSNEIKRSERGQGGFSLIIFDLDHFKKINDTLGHMAGDRLLVTVAKIAQKRTRDIDVVGRWGGEEFFVICPQTNLQGAEELAEQLRLAIFESASPMTYSVTASFGVGEYLLGESAEDIIERVDQALFLAKDDGRNCVRSLQSDQSAPLS
jgi:diguanylate cyclase (GGDEF)-like protein/PAS domain S-box-containing protein